MNFGVYISKLINNCKVSAFLLAEFGYFVQLGLQFSGTLVSHKWLISDKDQLKKHLKRCKNVPKGEK